jgi:hypothetical protein
LYITKDTCRDDPIKVNDQHFEVVTSAKILGMTITDDLKWKAHGHVANILLTASKRLYLLKQLKRADVDTISLTKFYCNCIRSVLEYGCQAFHSSLPSYLSKEIEQIQKRAPRIIYPCIYMDYGEALMMENLERLKDRRERDLCEKLFREIEENEDHKLHVLLPETNKAVHNFRTIRKYNLPKIRTNRFKDSFILEYASRKELNLF